MTWESENGGFSPGSTPCGPERGHLLCGEVVNLSWVPLSTAPDTDPPC